jgi:GNAT superfamily N-acetyltransferase
MWYRQTRAEFGRNRGAKNKRAIKRLVEAGRAPGILAYAGREAVGWCSVAPREEFTRLARSRASKPVDDRPVWSVVCFFVKKEYRRRGVTAALLAAAAQHVAQRGGKSLEGYPIESRAKRMADAFAWVGFDSAFRRAGFREVARHTPTRPIMRRVVRGT